MEHVDSSALLRIFNAHIRSSVATRASKEAIDKKLCKNATSTHGSGVAQPTAAQHATPLPWAIVRDLNVDAGTMMKWCQPFLKNVPCLSTSRWPRTRDAQKADVAYSQGVALIEVQSWIGWHSQPCASDTHDEAVVMGTVDQHPSSGNTHPVANLATPRAIADGIKSGQGESKS